MDFSGRAPEVCIPTQSMGTSKIALGSEADGAPGMTFYSTEGTALSVLGVTPEDKPIIVFKDKDGQLIWRAGHTQTMQQDFALPDPQ